MKNFSFLFMLFFLFCGQVSADDEEYNVNQIPYDAIGVATAHSAGFTGKNVTVAVVDNGVLTSHQELIGQISDLQTDEYNSAEAFKDHGTPVAGIIAGRKNGLGMHGIAYDAKILAFAVKLEGDGDCPSCYQTPVEAWQVLADDAFDSVKIINNSFGTSFFLPTSVPSSYITALNSWIIKDKLIVASAGNETNLSPVSGPAGAPYYSAALKNNTISAIAYDPNYSPSSPYFLTSYTNLAQYAQEWSLAAPVGSIYAPSNSGVAAYNDSFVGTSAAAPVISGAAAVVSSAFPYMGGKQIADVLFSTADKNYASFSNYMVQKGGNKNQFLFFGTEDGYGKNWTDAEKLAVVRSELGAGYTCDSETVVCVDVSYADVFGQGLLNLGKAVRGPGYFDANRLVSADYDGNQYLYPVNTQGYDSIWSNNIGERRNISEHPEAPVGLKKNGSGILTLAGNNTYQGETIVTEGVLRLKGSLAGNVSVSGGTFYLNGGTVPQITSLAGTITIDGGQAQNVVNAAEARQSGGTASTVENTGSFYLSGTGKITNSLTNDGNFYLNGGSLSGTIGNSGEFYLNGGTFSGVIQNTGTVRNSSVLKTGSVAGGTLINGETGTLYPMSTPDTLTNYGRIALMPAVGNPEAIQPINAVDVNLISGGFVLDQNNLPRLRDGVSYLVVAASGELFVGEDFPLTDRITQYISSQASVNSTEKTVSVSLDFLPIASSANSSSLTPEERKTAATIDRLFKQNGLNLSGFYFFDQAGLKKQINKMRDQARPLQFSSLPLSDKLTRGVQTHIFERQLMKDPLRYEGRMQYYSPSSKSSQPKGDVYKQYRPGNAPQENYRYKMPQSKDVYQQYRPENAPREEYRYYAPKKRDVYRSFRPKGHSGGQAFGIRKQAWGQMLYHQGTLKSDGATGLASADSTGIGAMFGWDFVYSDNFLWGLTAGYAQSAIEQGQDKTDVTDWRLGTYFSGQKDFISIDGALMFGRQSYDKTRMTVLPTETFKSTASFSGSSIEATLNIGYDIQSLPLQPGDMSFRPYVGLTVSKMSQDAYTEQGNSDVNLSVKALNDTSVTTSPGLIAGFVMDEMMILGFQPEYVFFDVRYDYLLSGGNPKTQAYFSKDALQASFDCLDNKEKSAFSVGFGINGRFSQQTKLNLLVNQRSGSKSTVRTISASLIYSF
ncbi:MAG: S8 family serine peptidase [Alphaproteobacteria bacterium]|nr:S8 family serine peptidase [Alphaproteobacteria bacterium]